MSALHAYHYPEQYGHLLREVGEHELQILHEDGMYRHLRFAKPGTGMYHWDLITWPGSLAIRGDIGGGHIFTRERDMLAFFDHGQASGWINADYWAEKLDRGERSVRKFSADRFVEWLKQETVHRDTVAIADEALNLSDAGEAIELLNDHGIAWDFEDPESWMDYDYHFILGLHAILWGAKKYHDYKAVAD